MHLGFLIVRNGNDMFHTKLVVQKNRDQEKFLRQYASECQGAFDKAALVQIQEPIVLLLDKSDYVGSLVGAFILKMPDALTAFSDAGATGILLTKKLCESGIEAAYSFLSEEFLIPDSANIEYCDAPVFVFSNSGVAVLDVSLC